MKIIVCGDRRWDDAEFLHHRLDALNELSDIDLVIEGCAVGADSLSGDHPNGWARLRGVASEHHPALWRRFGKPAGPIRNREMAMRKPDLVVAFHDYMAASKGTADMVRIAHHEGIPVLVVSHLGERSLLSSPPDAGGHED